MWKHECRTCGATWEASYPPAAYPPGETAPCGHEYGQVRIAPEREQAVQEQAGFGEAYCAWCHQYGCVCDE